MVKWKEAFDSHTQMPKALPLPTGFFVNHGHDSYDNGKGNALIVESSSTIEISASLEKTCKEVNERAEAAGIYHMNPMSGDGIYEGFTSFMERILEDQEINHRNEELVDELWDESIKVKQRISMRPISLKPGVASS